MTLAALVLLAAMMPSMTESTRGDTDPLSRYRWTHRLLVIHVPDSEAGRAALHAFRTAVEAAMEDVRDRDLLIVPVGDLPDADRPLPLAAVLTVAERQAVRRRLGLEGRLPQLVLIGKDGGVKARQSEHAFDLAGLLALIDTMPMRRAETRRP